MNRLVDLRERLNQAVASRPVDGIIFSGGLDTTILAYILSKIASNGNGESNGRRPVHAISVAVGRTSEDLKFSKALSRRFRLKQSVLRFDCREIFRESVHPIRILKTFDPTAVRNQTVIYCALKKAKSLGLKTVMTGDGGDELFAGYSFLFDKSAHQLQYTLRRMQKIMFFTSRNLGKALGIEIVSPYLHPRVQSLARSLTRKDLIASHRGRRIGKAILRRAFAGDIPEKFLWRTKMPIEIGSGSSRLNDFWDKEMGDAIFERGRLKIYERDGIRIRGKGQLFCYRAYRKLFGPPEPAGAGRGLVCPDCGQNVIPEESLYCHTCGLWPVRRVSKRRR
jgi:asparagine synthase (glutamine-hydrolysing)